MTNEQVLDLKSGDIVALHTNGVISRCRIREITAKGICDYEKAKAYGQAFVYFRGNSVYDTFESDSDTWTSIKSDEYIQAEGYATHDRKGKRILGYELIS